MGLLTTLIFNENTKIDLASLKTKVVQALESHPFK